MTYKKGDKVVVLGMGFATVLRKVDTGSYRVQYDNGTQATVGENYLATQMGRY